MFGLALIVSAAIMRPFLARALTKSDGITAAWLTTAWGIALLAIAAGQLAGALAGFGSITSPAGFATRFGFALAAETILLGASVAYARRSAPGEGPRVRVGTNPPGGKAEANNPALHSRANRSASSGSSAPAEWCCFARDERQSS